MREILLLNVCHGWPRADLGARNSDRVCHVGQEPSAQLLPLSRVLPEKLGLKQAGRNWPSTAGCWCRLLQLSSHLYLSFLFLFTGLVGLYKMKKNQLRIILLVNIGIVGYFLPFLPHNMAIALFVLSFTLPIFPSSFVCV